MQLYFVRHAQSYNNKVWEDYGPNDNRRMSEPPLTEVGRRQTEVVAQFLASHHLGNAPTRDARILNVEGFGITHIYSSPMIRALDTAAAIAHATNLQPVIMPGLHENWGIWHYDENHQRIPEAGNDRTFFIQNYPQFQLPDNFAPPPGWWNYRFETETDVVNRAEGVLKDIISRHGAYKDRVVIVSHGGFFNSFLRHLLNMTLSMKAMWFSKNNTAVSRFDFKDNTFRVGYLNRIDFMPLELLT